MLLVDGRLDDHVNVTSICCRFFLYTCIETNARAYWHRDCLLAWLDTARCCLVLPNHAISLLPLPDKHVLFLYKTEVPTRWRKILSHRMRCFASQCRTVPCGDALTPHAFTLCRRCIAAHCDDVHVTVRRRAARTVPQRNAMRRIRCERTSGLVRWPEA